MYRPEECKHINMREVRKDGVVIRYCPDCGYLPYGWGKPDV